MGANPDCSLGDQKLFYGSFRGKNYIFFFAYWAIFVLATINFEIKIPPEMRDFFVSTFVVNKTQSRPKMLSKEPEMVLWNIFDCWTKPEKKNTYVLHYLFVVIFATVTAHLEGCFFRGPKVVLCFSTSTGLK